jgi:ribosomal protein L37AE/L43A
MCILRSLFGYPAPDGLVGCFYCSRRTTAAEGFDGPRHRLECDWCNAAFEKIATCPECGWKKGVRDANFYLFTCDCCGEEICSPAFKLAEDVALNAAGMYSSE